MLKTIASMQIVSVETLTAFHLLIGTVADREGFQTSSGANYKTKINKHRGNVREKMMLPQKSSEKCFARYVGKLDRQTNWAEKLAFR